MNAVVMHLNHWVVVIWLCLLLGSGLLSFKKCCAFFFKQPWLKWLFIISCSFFIVVEGFIIGHGFSFNTPTNSDYLIVLGAKVRGKTPSAVLASRLDVAYDYLVHNSKTKAVLTGGQGPDEIMTEAAAMRDYLVAKGIDPSRLILETKATNTDENIRFSFELIHKEQADASVILVTSRFHVLRGKMIASDLNQEVDGLGSSILPFLIPTYYLREFFAVVQEAIC